MWMTLALVTCSALPAFGQHTWGGAVDEIEGLVMEGGARLAHDEDIEGAALVLDGVEGSYARAAAPQEWGRLRNVRVEARLRLPQYRAATVPIGWPGSFLIYIAGHGKPWALYWTDTGRHIIQGEDPVPPGQWLDIAFEYRAEDVCLLYVNGRSVAGLKGRGPLKEGGPDVWLGRYSYEDEKTGAEQNAWMRGAVARAQVTVLADDDRYEMDTTDLRHSMNVSWGDAIVVGEGWRKLNHPDHVAQFIEECERLGVRKVFLRADTEFILNFCDRRMDDDHWFMRALAAVEGDMLGALVRGCREAGIKVYAYQSVFDMGSPTTVLYGGHVPYFWESEFYIRHPEFLMESPDGERRQWGVPCYAYPEARGYMLSILRHILDQWEFDGLYLCTRTHSKPAEHADDFGYNAPIAEEFRRRHGVDIRTEEFSRPQWWNLLGEQLTLLLRDARGAFPDMEIVVAMPRADHIGPPYGNMRLDWRTWVRERLVDGLVIGVISGGWHYPDTRNRPGYVQSQQDNVAMRDLGYDLGEWFGPECAASGVELYLQRSSIYSDADRDLLEHPGVTGFMMHF